MKGEEEQKAVNKIGQLRIRKVINQKIEIKSVGCKTLKQIIHELNNQIFDEQLERKYEELLNEDIFIFNVIYDGQTWEIRRTIKQFEKLEEEITNNAIYYFFKNKEITKSLVQHDPQKTLKNLLSFLKIYSSNEIIPECVLHFLELSSIYLPLKVKECFMFKKAGGRQNQNQCRQCQQSVYSKWERRYFIITQSSLLYLKGPDEHSCQIRECLSFDYSFDFLYGKKQTGEETGIIIQFSQRKLKIKAPNLPTYIDFMYALFLSKQKSPYTKLHRFESFSPIRNSECKWYVDGDQYFNDVYDAIQNAKEMIYITDWWLSPEVYLKRPVNSREFVIDTENRQSRIDVVLENAANQRNVIVLILVYNAPFLLYNNPQHTKKSLEAKSKNIRVLKHPSQVPPFLFSHHEKMVVIDQTIAFMGGLDLCFGRWDDQKHLLFDIHPYDQLWPQIDFSNSRIRDFLEVQNYQKTLLRENEPRMPWHDIAIQIQGDTVIDLARHFVQYWNHVMMGKLKKKKQVLLHANDLKIETIYNTIKSELSNLAQESNLIYIGRKESIIQMKQPFLINHQDDNNQCNHSGDIEMNKPQNDNYRDTKSEDKSQNLQTSNLRLANKIIEIEVEEEENQYYRPMNKNTKEQKPGKQQVNQKNQQHSNAEGIQAKIKLEYFEAIINLQDQKKTCITQLTRSSSKWSTGIKYTEHSIQNAYVELILNAKQFIYIENQFFMSDSAGKPLKNKISTALVERIKEASQRRQKFKVVVFLPLLPGFEGEIDQDNSTVLKIQLHYEYLTISRGGNSIIEQLTQAGINSSDYINFYGLRQHAKQENNLPVTEIIYIHSKLMIVDDEIALIGSANINDRSLNGNRDSELAIIVQDQMLIDSYMNQQQVKIPKFAHTLRVNLYSEHFGLQSEEVQDPLSPLLEKEIKIRTSVNTKMYKEIFACYPDDKIKTVADYAAFKEGKKLELYDQYSAFIKGHAVEFPLQFLCDENLKIPYTCKEYYVDDISFT